MSDRERDYEHPLVAKMKAQSYAMLDIWSMQREQAKKEFKEEAEEFVRLCEKGDANLQVIRKQLRDSLNLARYKNSYPLRVACKHGQLRTAKLLVEEGNADIHAPTSSDDNWGLYVNYPNGALLQACSHGHVSIVRWLVQLGCHQPTRRDSKEPDDDVIEWAIRGASVDCVDILIEAGWKVRDTHIARYIADGCIYGADRDRLSHKQMISMIEYFKDRLTREEDWKILMTQFVQRSWDKFKEGVDMIPKDISTSKMFIELMGTLFYNTTKEPSALYAPNSDESKKLAVLCQGDHKNIWSNDKNIHFLAWNGGTNDESHQRDLWVRLTNLNCYFGLDLKHPEIKDQALLYKMNLILDKLRQLNK